MIECLPYDTISGSSHFALAAVPHGGHLGWFDGPLTGPEKHRRWHVRPTLEFLTGALNELDAPSECTVPLVIKDQGGWKWADGIGWKVVDDVAAQCGKST
jgi:hypothetical protein